MTWFDKIVDAVQSAAVIGERVERLGNSVGDVATELRELDRRVSRLEGAMAARGVSGKTIPEQPRPPDDDT